jgi:hypothetical protein
MNRKIFAIPIALLLAGVVALLTTFAVAADSSGGGNHWLPWTNGGLCTAPGGCWVNDCSGWNLGSVAAIPDSTGVTVTFKVTVGDFATGPKNGHVTVGVNGTFSNPTLSQVASDTVDYKSLFTGTVLDDEVIPGTIVYSKHFSMSVGTYTFVVLFGQDGCENCGQVSDPVTVSVTHTNNSSGFKPDGTVWWTVDKRLRDPMTCHFAIYDGGVPMDSNVLPICNYYLIKKNEAPLWFKGQWFDPHSYIEGTLDGVKVYQDSWTGMFVPWSTITASGPWY